MVRMMGNNLTLVKSTQLHSWKVYLNNSVHLHLYPSLPRLVFSLLLILGPDNVKRQHNCLNRNSETFNTVYRVQTFIDKTARLNDKVCFGGHL